jgi:uncharacterized protein
MIVLLSPSKTMDCSGASPDGPYTTPDFLSRSGELIKTLRTRSTKQLMDQMKISQKLAEQNHQRFQQWQLPFTPQNARQALFAFSGDVYEGLEATSLTANDINFAQQHIRILSGLYGLLRPLDLIQPYRLEMGQKIVTSHASDLYQFWQETLTQKLNQLPGETIINLASQEYIKAIQISQLNKRLITPLFKEEKKEKLQVISFYAKRARGLMTRYIIQHQLTTPEKISQFSAAGYQFKPNASNPNQLLFIRKHPLPAHL